MEIGAPAVLTVVEVLRLVLEPALTLLQITVETNVREKLMIHKLATRILVQVMHSFFSGMEGIRDFSMDNYISTGVICIRIGELMHVISCVCYYNTKTTRVTAIRTFITPWK